MIQLQNTLTQLGMLLDYIYCDIHFVSAINLDFKYDVYFDQSISYHSCPVVDVQACLDLSISCSHS